MTDSDSAEAHRWQHGPIVGLYRIILKAAQYVSPSWILGRRIVYLKDRAELSQEQAGDLAFIAARLRVLDGYILAWFAVVSLVSIAYWFWWPTTLFSAVAVFLSLIRIIEVLRVNINTAVFDQLHHRPDNRVASTPRLVAIALLTYTELILCFGIVYTGNLDHVLGATAPSDAFYFSAVSQLTVGYGDLLPSSFVRPITVVQALAGFGIGIVAIARMVGSLPPLKDVLSSK